MCEMLVWHFEGTPRSKVLEFIFFSTMYNFWQLVTDSVFVSYLLGWRWAKHPRWYQTANGKRLCALELLGNKMTQKLSDRRCERGEYPLRNIATPLRLAFSSFRIEKQTAKHGLLCVLCDGFRHQTFPDKRRRVFLFFFSSSWIIFSPFSKPLLREKTPMSSKWNPIDLRDHLEIYNVAFKPLIY